MSITSKQLCQVSGCRHKAATSINTKVGAVMICWYACDPCAKRSRGPAPDPVCEECRYTVNAHRNDCSKRDPLVVWVPDTLRRVAAQRDEADAKRKGAQRTATVITRERPEHPGIDDD